MKVHEEKISLYRNYFNDPRPIIVCGEKMRSVGNTAHPYEHIME